MGASCPLLLTWRTHDSLRFAQREWWVLPYLLICVLAITLGSSGRQVVEGKRFAEAMVEMYNSCPGSLGLQSYLLYSALPKGLLASPLEKYSVIKVTAISGWKRGCILAPSLTS